MYPFYGVDQFRFLLYRAGNGFDPFNNRLCVYLSNTLCQFVLRFRSLGMMDDDAHRTHLLLWVRQYMRQGLSFMPFVGREAR